MPLRFSYAQLIQQLLQHICPDLSDEQIANILESSFPKVQQRPTVVSTEELAAVLGDDAALYQEEQQPDQEKEAKSLQGDIRRVVQQLRQTHSSSKVIEPGVTYWKGKADQSWTSEDFF